MDPGENMGVQDELRQLEERRQMYLSTVQDPSTTRVQREEALGDLELTEDKIAKLGKRCTPDDHQFDLGGEA
jgi:hypothetical protein